MFKPNKIVEYRVRPVTRYIITRYHREDLNGGMCHAGCESIGSFESQAQAEQVAQALSERERGSTYISGIPSADK